MLGAEGGSQKMRYHPHADNDESPKTSRSLCAVHVRLARPCKGGSRAAPRPLQPK